MGFGNGVQVKLTIDLTRYHASLRPGIVGITTHLPTGRFAANISGRICWVKFPEITAEVEARFLQVVDPTVKALEKAEREAFLETLRTSTVTATRRTGPRGKFRSLVVVYGLADGSPAQHVVGVKSEAVALEKFLVEHAGVEIDEEQE